MSVRKVRASTEPQRHSPVAIEVVVESQTAEMSRDRLSVLLGAGAAWRHPILVLILKSSREQHAPGCVRIIAAVPTSKTPQPQAQADATPGSSAPADPEKQRAAYAAGPRRCSVTLPRTCIGRDLCIIPSRSPTPHGHGRGSRAAPDAYASRHRPQPKHQPGESGSGDRRRTANLWQIDESYRQERRPPGPRRASSGPGPDVADACCDGGPLAPPAANTQCSPLRCSPPPW